MINKALQHKVGGVKKEVKCVKRKIRPLFIT